MNNLSKHADESTTKGTLLSRTKIGFEKNLGRVSLIAGALAILPYMASTYNWFEELDAVDLPDAFKGEIWEEASIDKVNWMEGDWFYPNLPQFYTHFKIEDGILYQQNEGAIPNKFITEWVSTKIFISNRDVLRLRYLSKDWDGTFIYKEDGVDYRFYNNERYVGDDGTVTSGDKRVVLRKDRCKISEDGMTYECW